MSFRLVPNKIVGWTFGTATCLFVGILASCGQQTTPVFQSAKSSVERSESEGLSPNTMGALRSSSADEPAASEAAGTPAKPVVFSKKIEPLNLQKGGTAKIALPFSDDARLIGQMRSISFVTASAALKESSVQGRTLSVVVSEDASEGRHEGRVVVRFDNGAEFSQPLSISVLP